MWCPENRLGGLKTNRSGLSDTPLRAAGLIARGRFTLGEGPRPFVEKSTITHSYAADSYTLLPAP